MQQCHATPLDWLLAVTKFKTTKINFEGLFGLSTKIRPHEDYPPYGTMTYALILLLFTSIIQRICIRHCKALNFIIDNLYNTQCAMSILPCCRQLLRLLEMAPLIVIMKDKSTLISLSSELGYSADMRECLRSALEVSWAVCAILDGMKQPPGPFAVVNLVPTMVCCWFENHVQ